MYKKFSLISIGQNYKGRTCFNDNFLFYFKKYRKSIIKKLDNNNNNKSLVDNSDSTFYEIKKINCLKSIKNFESKIVIFYRKFEINLQLKKQYDKNFNKKTDIETNIASYVLLGDLIIKSNKIEKIKKINCLLKLNDLVCININNLSVNYYENFKKLIIFEQKALKKIFNDY